MCDFLEPLLTCDLQKLKSLINLGRSVNSIIPGTEGLTPLHVAVGIENPDGTQIVSFLLKNGSNPNSRSFDEFTPVHIATMWNNCLNLELLLKHGGDPWLTDYENKNSFDMALNHNAHEAYQLLNKFVALEMLTPEEKASAYKNGFYNKVTENASHKMSLGRNKADIIDLLLADHDKSETSQFLTANENFPLYLSSTDEDASELCCNVSKFLKKRNGSGKSKDIYSGNFKSNYIDIVRTNERPLNAQDSFLVAKKRLNERNSNSSSSEITSELDTETSTYTEKINKGFLLSSTESITSDSSSIQNNQFKNKFIEIDTDRETGIVLVEESRPNSVISDTSNDGDISVCTVGSGWRMYQSDNFDSTLSICSTQTLPEVEVPEDLKQLNNSKLYEELKRLGDNPGPVLDCIRHIYLQRLARLRSGAQTVDLLPKPKYCSEIYLFLENKLDMEKVYKLEEIMAEEFDVPLVNKKWREGNQRFSFNYFLLDPRVTKNLPARAHLLSLKEKFIIFLEALFYVGKGTRGRPYSHLFEAAKAMSSVEQNNEKIKHILDIWNADLGVISLHCFHNSIPVEAYTREACMIDAIGLSNLTNIKNGNFYGISARWTMSRKRQLGISFLYRALEIHLLEGERLIRPKDICRTT